MQTSSPHRTKISIEEIKSLIYYYEIKNVKCGLLKRFKGTFTIKEKKKE